MRELVPNRSSGGFIREVVFFLFEVTVASPLSRTMLKHLVGKNLSSNMLWCNFFHISRVPFLRQSIFVKYLRFSMPHALVAAASHSQVLLAYEQLRDKFRSSASSPFRPISSSTLPTALLRDTRLRDQNFPFPSPSSAFTS